jgi:luciferase family oxidoreductase group 1
MKLSVLDQSPIRSGGSAEQALRETIELAQITERLGYHRYWVAEHHGSDSFAGSVPELLIGQIAEKPYTDALASVRATPAPHTDPELWMLGSTEDGARIAAQFGLPFAHFISPAVAERAIGVYRDDFQPAAAGSEPEASIGVFVLCCDTDEEAQQLALCRDVWRSRVERGEFGPFPSIAEAKAYEMNDAERNRIAERQEHQILGRPEGVREHLDELARRCGVEELVVVSITHEFSHRVRCYELLSPVYELS